ncbi:hypothetical protein VTK26DRAFT_3396 [Humicola hyalothermophila]
MAQASQSGMGEGRGGAVQAGRTGAESLVPRGRLIYVAGNCGKKSVQETDPAKSQPSAAKNGQGGWEKCCLLLSASSFVFATEYSPSHVICTGAPVRAKLPRASGGDGGLHVATGSLANFQGSLSVRVVPAPFPTFSSDPADRRPREHPTAECADLPHA